MILVYNDIGLFEVVVCFKVCEESVNKFNGCIVGVLVNLLGSVVIEIGYYCFFVLVKFNEVEIEIRMDSYLFVIF